MAAASPRTKPSGPGFAASFGSGAVPSVRRVRPRRFLPATLRGFCVHATRESPDTDQALRVSDGTSRYIHGSYQWTRKQRSRTMPTLNDYLLLRSDECAGSWMVPFYPLIGGYQLTPEEANDPLALIITDLVPLIGALDNDVISHHREAASASSTSSTSCETRTDTRSPTPSPTRSPCATAS
ncbi:terpene synthase family protein [Streptomyces sp. NPDC058412]|uniref:terpene synthase family protein n=1 Tax=Streptomyces sp. NPDC058412 TaxID=3346486 RepID=UPI003658396B